MASAIRPILSAHRHGNDLALLDEALGAGADLVEVDVHLFWSRLEVRHHKTIGPLPVLFDKGEPWHLGRWPLRFEDVVDSLPEGLVLHLDLKGWSPRLARRVRRVLGTDRPYVVSTRSWWLLRPFRGRAEVRTMRSIGAPWQLRWFLLRHRGGVTDDVCIRADRLTPELARRLRSRCERLLVWRVDTLALADELVAMGVHGLIVDDLTVIRTIVERAHGPRPEESPPVRAPDAVPRGDQTERRQ